MWKAKLVLKKNKIIDFKQSEIIKENNNTINYNIAMTHNFGSVLLFKGLPPRLLLDAISLRSFNIFNPIHLSWVSLCPKRSMFFTCQWLNYVD